MISRFLIPSARYWLLRSLRLVCLLAMCSSIFWTAEAVGKQNGSSDEDVWGGHWVVDEILYGNMSPHFIIGFANDVVLVDDDIDAVTFKVTVLAHYKRTGSFATTMPASVHSAGPLRQTQDGGVNFAVDVALLNKPSDGATATISGTVKQSPLHVSSSSFTVRFRYVQGEVQDEEDEDEEEEEEEEGGGSDDGGSSDDDDGGSDGDTDDGDNGSDSGGGSDGGGNGSGEEDEEEEQEEDEDDDGGLDGDWEFEELHPAVLPPPQRLDDLAKGNVYRCWTRLWRQLTRQYGGLTSSTGVMDDGAEHMQTIAGMAHSEVYAAGQGPNIADDGGIDPIPVDFSEFGIPEFDLPLVPYHLEPGDLRSGLEKSVEFGRDLVLYSLCWCTTVSSWYLLRELV